MDSSCRSQAQQFKSITVVRHPISWLQTEGERRLVAPAGPPNATCEPRWAARIWSQRTKFWANRRPFGIARRSPTDGLPVIARNRGICSDRGSHCEYSAEPSLALRNPVVGLPCLCQRIRLDNRLNFSLRYEIKCFVQIFGAVLPAANYSNAFGDEIH